MQVFGNMTAFSFAQYRLRRRICKRMEKESGFVATNSLHIAVMTKTTKKQNERFVTVVQTVFYAATMHGCAVHKQNFKVRTSPRPPPRPKYLTSFLKPLTYHRARWTMKWRHEASRTGYWGYRALKRIRYHCIAASHIVITSSYSGRWHQQKQQQQQQRKE